MRREPKSSAPVPPELLALAIAVAASRPLAKLIGSPSQCSYASSVRGGMIRQAVNHRDTNRATVLCAVADAGYFTAHSRLRYDEWTWPTPEQLAREMPLERLGANPHHRG